MEKIDPAVKLWERFQMLPWKQFRMIRSAFMVEFMLKRTEQFEFRLSGRFRMRSEEIAFLADLLGCSIPELMTPEYNFRVPEIPPAPVTSE